MDHIHNSEGDIAAALQPFVGVMPAQLSHYKPYKLQVLSRESIPFTITPEMKAVLRQSFQDRFDIIAGVGHLHPATMFPCPVCGEEGQWSPEEHRSHSTTIVCSNQVFKAEGKQGSNDLTLYSTPKLGLALPGYVANKKALFVMLVNGISRFEAH